MASHFLSFDPDSIASTSDVASSAYDLAGTASDVASSAMDKAAAASTAASSALALAAGVASTASDASSLASQAETKAAAASTAASSALALVAAKIASTLDTAPASSSIVGFRGSFAASAALAFPQLCYINTNGFADLANANSAATATGMLVLAPGSVANAASFAAILPGTFVGHSTWNWTKGSPIYMGSSAGSMTQTRPSAASAIVRVVGYGGKTSNIMYFNPDGAWVEVT